jgi:DNA segregation ATPase FtsK/SpoIIIE, S-DNA-T family
MELPLTLVTPDGTAQDVLIRWQGRATIRQSAAAAKAALPATVPDGTGPAAPALYRDGRPLDADLPLDDTGLRPGDILHLIRHDRPGSGAAPAAPGYRNPALGLHLAVVGGPAAGAMFPLPLGEHVLGRSPECALRLADGEISRQHLAVTVTGQAVTLHDLDSTNGTYLDGERITGEVPLQPGQLVEAGASRLQLRPGSGPGIELRPGRGGYLEVRRPPRLHHPESPAEIERPGRPREPERRAIPLLATLAPVVLGGVLWAVTRNASTLLFVALSPVMMIGNVISDRFSGRRKYRRDLVSYQQRLAEAEHRLADELLREGRRRREEQPDPAALLATALGPDLRLWERRRDGPDFLVLRLGLAELDSAIRVSQAGPAAEELLGQQERADGPLRVPDVPCTLPLAEVGVLGVAGPGEAVRSAARWLLGQSAVASGPSDLRVVLLTTEQGEEAWGWARWLPHVTPDHRWPVPGLGTTAESVATRVRELVGLIEQRERAAGTTRPADRLPGPCVLVVLDAAHDLRALPGMEVVLSRGPAAGVTAICLEAAEQRLPVECRAIVTAGEDGRATLRRTGEPPVDDILADGVSPDWSENLARALAPFTDPEGELGGGLVPESVRLADLLGAGATTAAGVAEAWQRAPRSTSAVVGAGADGPVRLDLSRDGPHALVGGTTGAGKSEFLQTLVTSLAVANRPDALNFLLIDYKGGAAFLDCARLPHTVGVVTDLDRHLTERALRSLSAELKRRERLLAQVRAIDIEGYLAAGEPAGRLPRLVIIIDEFAGLAAELPEFVTGLVAIAQRGRSLGVHLVLATQRPSGVVSPEIRANTNLKVALRVTSAAESADIIDAPDAARILPATPGRAYARTAHSSLVLFQSARVGGPAPRPAGGEEARVTVTTLPWDRAGWLPAPDPAAPPAPGQAGDEQAAETDLARLVGAVAKAAEVLGIGRPPRPWLPPLPEVLPLAGLPRPAGLAGGLPPAAPYALVDLPDEQAQRPVTFDLPSCRHLLVVGSAGSGRTTTLRTLAASMVASYDVADLWLYGIDCGGGELRALAALPHTGAIVARSEPDRASRLLGRLKAEVNRRLDLLADGGFSDLAEQRAASPAGARLPYLMVMIDRWETFQTAFGDLDGGRLVEDVLELATEGGAAGLRVVVTGDRSLLTGKLSSAVDDRICLSLADRTDFALAGLNVRGLPLDMPPGRAVRPGDGAELQVALPGTDPSGPGQAAAMATLAGQVSARDARGPRPFRVDPLPATIGLAELRQLPGWQPAPLWAVAGAGGDERAAFGVDLATHEPGFTVTGPRRSGRSTALLAMAESLLAGGNAVLVLCPRPSPLRGLTGRPGVVAVLSGLQPPTGQLVALLNETPGPFAVVVDDAPALHATVVGDLLDQQVAESPEKGHTMIIAGVAEDLLRPMRGFIPEVRQSRSGLLLCPESHLHGEVVGIRLPRSAAFSRPPGRGVLVLDNQATLVQVPFTGGAGGT